MPQDQRTAGRRSCVVREGYRRLLERDDTLAVVGEAATAADAMRIDAELEPDVIVRTSGLPESADRDSPANRRAQTNARVADVQHASRRDLCHPGKSTRALAAI